MRLPFNDAAVRKSKMLFSTNGSTAQTFTITPRLVTTPLTSGVTYAVTEPAGCTGPITLDSAAGTVSFGREVYDKVTRSRTPERVTVQATHQGKTASYTFTVTDSPNGTGTARWCPLRHRRNRIYRRRKRAGGYLEIRR